MAPSQASVRTKYEPCLWGERGVAAPHSARAEERPASTTMTPVASSSVREVATELMHLLRLSLVTRGCY